MNYKPIINKIIKNKWKDSQIDSIEKMPKGFSFPVFAISLKNPCKNVIIKIVEDERQAKRGHLEQNAIKLILSKFPDFPVPHIIKFDETKQIIDHPYIIEEKITGADLSDIDLSKIKNKEEFIRYFAKYAGQMNSIVLDNFGYFDENLNIKATSWISLIKEELTRYIENIEKKEFLDKTLLIKVKEYIEKNLDLMKINEKPRFIHNDYHGGNIKVNIINNQYTITGIFDFEICMSGDPVRELYKAEWVLKKLPNYRKYFYEEYSTYVKLPKNYKKRLEFYELLGRLKHIQLRDHFETSSYGKGVIKEGIEIIQNIVEM